MASVKYLFIIAIGAAILGVANSLGLLGSCPPTLSVDVCDAQCGPQHKCQNSTQLCCPTDCGGAMCVDAMTERHFVNLIKPGNCPEHPRGVWICSHMCTGDSDCPRALKCCTNRCGALTCQKPEMDDQPQL
ncbi:WAP four-disulfide core domain protein 2-like [Aricia agestis]|uniref:WAP four-disulfide core domain protein 2-like n=1 Tax=Aricia agestis TaxID=91739 RepID=UPI001C202EA8|nr:WAP four-disulfide core domain protein 2-like [Aricia agestis]